MFWIIIKVALSSLWASKLRSFLAILGIIMGVGAVISMLSIVEGASRQIGTMIGSLGTDVLLIMPDARSATGRTSVARLGINDARALLDAEAIIRVSPQASTSVIVKYQNKSVRTSLDGVAPTMFIMRNMEIEKGRAFTDSEVRLDAAVAVLGSQAADKIFGKRDPLDQRIKLNKRVYRVIGVLKSKGARGFGNDDDKILAPFTIVQRQMTGRRADISTIVIQAASTAQLGEAENQARQILRKRHQLAPDAKDDFALLNQAQLLEMQGRVVMIMGAILGGIGGICLLTGGIGIMNIMLVIVTERTREIGLRKAVGARGRDILVQFLLESVVLSGLGGVLGVMGGWGLSTLIRLITELETVVSPFSVLLALSFATFVGVFFGFYPAWRASRLDPIVALHVE